jgi:hypothetical protein
MALADTYSTGKSGSDNLYWVKLFTAESFSQFMGGYKVQADFFLYPQLNFLFNVFGRETNEFFGLKPEWILKLFTQNLSGYFRVQSNERN